MEPILFNQLSCKKALLFFLTVLLCNSLAFSQTRFYLNLNTAATLTPTYNAGWNVTTGATRYAMNTTKDVSAITSKTTSAVSGIAVGRCLLDQWISDPLAAQTITGTFTGQIRFNVSNITSTTGQGFIYLRVINADGSIATEVGSATTTVLTATLTNRTMISLPVGTLNITAGQRICIDLGWSYNIVAAVSRTCTISRGSAAAADLAADNTTITANNPWVQFSQTLNFLPPANDACSGATLLTSAVACVNTSGTLIYATATAGLAACGNAASPEVWYSFVAQSAYPTITLSSVGANLTTAGPRIQLFSGTCGSLTQLTGACA
jgi:hypothetical protein